MNLSNNDLLFSGPWSAHAEAKGTLALGWKQLKGHQIETNLTESQSKNTRDL
jgi:hypothetical protein